MKPINFKQTNVNFAEHQPEYLTLPAHKVPDDPYGRVVTCWGLSFFEKVKLLFTGKLYITLLTYNKALTPLLPEIDLPGVLKEFIDEK